MRSWIWISEPSSDLHYRAELFLSQGTQVSMVIPQVGLPEDLLSTVTALIGAVPTLGGVIGVAVVGNGLLTPHRFTCHLTSHHSQSSTTRSGMLCLESSPPTDLI